MSRVDCGWSQCIRIHHAQTCPGMGYKCRIPSVKPLLTQRHCQKRLTQAKEKKNWTVAQWKFCISFGNKGPRVWRKRGEAQNPNCLKSSVKFPQSLMICCAISSAGVGPLCFIKSSQCSRLPGDFRSLHASICCQALWRC